METGKDAQQGIQERSTKTASAVPVRKSASPKARTLATLSENLTELVADERKIGPGDTATHLSDASAEAKVEPPVGGAETRSDSAQVETEDLDRLIEVLQSYDLDRRAELGTKYDNRQLDLLRASCLILIIGPTELGVDLTSSVLRDEARAILREAESEVMPEVCVCRLWLACADGVVEQGIAGELASLAKKPLWEPVQALAFRALAYYGHRQLLADLLPKDGPLSLVQADAWLEASHVGHSDSSFLARIVATENGTLTPAVYDRWTTLLTAEAALAQGTALDTAEDDLAPLTLLATGEPARNYAEAECQRIGARAAGALARAHLGQWRTDDCLLKSPAGHLLPAWEREYLGALARWQLDDCDGAVAGLKNAVERNPHQTSARLALAALLSDPSPEAALGVLEHDEPTREVHISHATLLARLSRYDEAEEELMNCDGERAAGCEPGRYSWGRGRAQSHRQEQVLRTALAEHRGGWAEAERSWRSASDDDGRKTLQQARHLFAAHRELKACAVGKSWRRSLLEQRSERGRHEISSIPLVGDAMFFRAAAMIETAPERAIKDFQTLLRRSAWTKAEWRAGGGRIIFAADALMRLGQASDAIRAYEMLASLSPTPEVKERLAVASIYSEVLRGAETSAILSVADHAAELAPTSSWPQLLAALGLAIAGDIDAALSRINAAEESGAHDLACRCLRSVCVAQSGTATLSGEDIGALHLPTEADIIVRFLCSEGTELGRMKTLLHSLGEEWISKCPTDSQLTAQRLLASCCDEGQWDEALKYANELVRTGHAWAIELAALVQLRHALERAMRGELEEADRELGELRSKLEQETD